MLQLSIIYFFIVCIHQFVYDYNWKHKAWEDVISKEELGEKWKSIAGAIED